MLKKKTSSGRKKRGQEKGTRGVVLEGGGEGASEKFSSFVETA